MSTTERPGDMGNQSWELYSQAVEAWSYAKRAADAMSEMAIGYAAALAPLMNVRFSQNIRSHAPEILQKLDEVHASTCRRLVYLRSVEKQAQQNMWDIGNMTYAQRYGGGGPDAGVDSGRVDFDQLPGQPTG